MFYLLLLLSDCCCQTVKSLISVTDEDFLNKSSFLLHACLSLFWTSGHQHDRMIWSVFISTDLFSGTYPLGRLLHPLAVLFLFCLLHCTFSISTLSVINQFVFEKDKPRPPTPQHVFCITNCLFHSARCSCQSIVLFSTDRGRNVECPTWILSNVSERLRDWGEKGERLSRVSLSTPPVLTITS